MADEMHLAVRNLAVLFVLLTALYGQNPAFPIADAPGWAGQKQGYTVTAQIVDADGTPVKSAFLELLRQGNGRRVAASPEGHFEISAIQSGHYDLVIDGGGFISLSQMVEIDKDIDLGRITMDRDPNVMPAASVMPPFSAWPSLTQIERPPVDTISDVTRPLFLRGLIRPFSVGSGGRLTVQLSCSEQRPGMNERPQWDIAQVPVDGTGNFESAVPACLSETLAHREVRFSLKDEQGKTLALLLPKLALDGYDQSRIGLWLPLKVVIENMQTHSVILIPEYTDNRPLRGTISVRPSQDQFTTRESIFLNATLTNTSEEAFEVPSFNDFLSDLNWTITDDRGQLVSTRPFQDRTAAYAEGRRLHRSHVLFPGESETYGTNINFMFVFTSAGTYQAVAKKTVWRLELPGEGQLESEPTTFVIVPDKDQR